MRIGIDYRMLSAGILAVNRGMGRYTQQQLREVLKIDSQNEYVLFCLPDVDRSLILPEIRSAPNVSVAMIEVTESRRQSDPYHPLPETVLRHAEEYQAWIYRQGVDLYHATTPFLWHDIVLPRFDACPMVVTFYDAISLVFPDYYLPPAASTTDLYLQALNFIRSARRLVAISEHSRQDALRYLGVPLERIDLAYPMADPWFRILTPDEAEGKLRRLRARLALPADFVMAVPHLHRSKNFETLLAGYALLSPTLRRQLPLVNTCHFTEEEHDYVQRLAARHGVVDSLINTGFVTDDELVALYNAATMLVHSSRYEGFGLPVLEALQCGTPVITTTASSLPEVGGDAAILVDPDDARGFADAIEAVYQDPDRRADMRRRGLAHAEHFDATQLAQNTLACYRKAVHTPPSAESGARQPRLALWTPLPPLRSGIADYSAELLEQLARLYEVEVFVDDGYLPAPELLYRYTVHHWRAFERRHAQRPFQVVLYQLGASVFHRYMYGPLQSTPGLVVVHDLVWSYVLYGELAGANRPDEFKRELEFMEGPAARREFEHIESLPAEAFGPALQDFLRRHYMLKKVAQGSLALVVQSDLEKEDLQAKYPEIPTYTVGMGVNDPWQGQSFLKPQVIREQLGVKSKTFVVGIFGIVHRIKRVDQCIRAFRAVCAHYPEAHLVIVGENPDPTYQHELADLVQALDLGQQVSFLGRTSRADFDRWLLACDVVLNLRFPSMKQISAILLRAMAAGKPLVVSQIPEWQFLPDEFTRKVAPDDHETDALAEALCRLAADPALRQKMSASARAFYENGYTVRDMVACYRSVIEQVTGLCLEFPSIAQQDPLPMEKSHYNKVCELEDFSDPELVETMRDVFRHEIHHFTPEFPRGAEYRKYWEIAMSVRALRHFGAIHSEAKILGVGAGTETTLFYLTNHVQLVFATDLYLNPNTWERFSPEFMLIAPEKIAPYEFDRNRLVVQHMDGRILCYPDNTFDGIFSSGSIEHFGNLDFIANAAYEMGRVLKPGGVLTLSTEYQVSGPPGGLGWEGCVLFTPEALRRYVVEASGLELVDDLDTHVSEQTLASQRDLEMYIREADVHMAQQGLYPRAGEIVWSRYPHLVLVHHGYVFGSVHLTLRKTENYPAKPNDWARPSQATLEAVMRLQEVAAPAPATPSTDPATRPAPLRSTEALNHLHARLEAWDAIRLKGWYNRTLRRLPKLIAALVRGVARLVYLGYAQKAQKSLYDALIEFQAELETRLAGTSVRLAAFEVHTQHEHAGLGSLTQQQSARVATLEADLARLATHLGEVEAHLTDGLSRQFTDLQDLQIKIESQVRQNTSELRFLMQQYEINQAKALESLLPRLTREDVRELVQTVERDLPDLAHCQSVEVSIQDASAEDALFSVTAYFGDRMASKGPTYRVPTDAWYHVDFSHDWKRDILFESAANRLGHAGKFILVTAPENTLLDRPERLQIVANRLITLASGRTVRVYIWQAP